MTPTSTPHALPLFEAETETEQPAAAPERPCEPLDAPRDRAPGREPPLAIRELLGFPMRLIADLPLPTTALCLRDGWQDEPCDEGPPEAVVLTTSGQVARRAVELGLPSFGGQEMRVLAAGVEQERIPVANFQRWCERKLAEPGYEVTTGEVFAGLSTTARAAIRPQGWQVSRVLAALQLHLIAVEAGAEEGLALLQDGEKRAREAGA